MRYGGRADSARERRLKMARVSGDAAQAETPFTTTPEPLDTGATLLLSITLTPEPLDTGAGAAFVASPRAGGLACFVGVTRAVTARGAAVARLDFEAHAPLAAAQLRRIVYEAQARARGALIAVHVAHRLGPVAVGEAAVVVWASAPHRAEALDAVQHVIDGLKARAAIWKREVLADGRAEWRANCEGCAAGAAP